MTFLPIVGRDLRVAARKWYTYWGRFSAAMLGFLIFAGMQTIFMLQPGGVPFNYGYYEFQVMKWFCFVITALAGLFLTADAVSEEKREGTLGLLFLTDLRGYDVVLGKLISRSTQAFYGLLAAFPMLGLSLLNGGVTGAEFGRSTLVLCNTIFISLAVGLLVSSFCHQATKALNCTLLCMLVITLGLLLIDLAMAGWSFPRFKPFFSKASPGYLLALAGVYVSRDWWTCLGLQHLMGWLFLVITAIWVPYAWQEKAGKPRGVARSLRSRLQYGNPRARIARRRGLLSRNPFLWLVSRDLWFGRIALATAVISVGLFILRVVHFQDTQRYTYWNTLMMMIGLLQFLITMIFFLWVASQSSRFLVEAMRNGAMELMLVTPMTPAEIVRGHWRALCRTFLLPALLLLAVMMGGHYLQFREMIHVTRAPAFGNGGSFFVSEIVGAICGVSYYTGDILALAWFGMWQGMISRKPSSAVLKTICFVVVLPGLVLLFVQGVVSIMIALPRWNMHMPYWVSMIIATALSIAKDVIFITWSQQRLKYRFRSQAAGGFTAIRFQSAVPPVLPRPAARPPALPPPMPLATQ